MGNPVNLDYEILFDIAQIKKTLAVTNPNLFNVDDWGFIYTMLFRLIKNAETRSNTSFEQCESYRLLKEMVKNYANQPLNLENDSLYFSMFFPETRYFTLKLQPKIKDSMQKLLNEIYERLVVFAPFLAREEKEEMAQSKAFCVLI